MRTTLAKLTLAAVALLAPAVGAQAQTKAWPTKPITLILPNNPGGATDRLARLLAPYISKELGVPFNIENKPGAQSLVGNTFFFNQPADGYTFLYTALPYLVNNIDSQGAKFKMDDFAWVNIPEIATSQVLVHKDRPYKDLASLVADLKVPQKLSAGVIAGSAEHIQALLLMDRLGVPRSNLRLVTFDGGGTARTAIAGGQVDFAMLPGEGSEVIAEFVRPLAVVSDKPLPGLNVPPINEALKPVGIELPILPSSTRMIVAHKAFRDKNPEAWKTFIDAYAKANANPEFQKAVAQAKLGSNWTGPEEATRIINENYDLIKKYSGTIQN